MNSLTVTGCTFVGDYDPENPDDSIAQYAIRAQFQTNVNISGNKISNFKANAIHVAPQGPAWEKYVESDFVISGNTISDIGNSAIAIPDVQNYQVSVAITGNTISNVCNIKGNGAIRVWDGSVYGVEISGNVIEDTHIGINTNALQLHDDATGEFVVSENAIAVIDKAVDGNLQIAGIVGTNIPEGAENANLIVNASEVPVNTDTARIYVNAAWGNASTEDKVVVGNKVYVIGTNAFASSLEALTKANELGGAVIDIDGMTAGEANYFAITNSGDYTITGGNGELFTRLGVTGKNINLTFEDAYFRLAWCYRTDETSTFTVNNSVIGKAPHSNSAPWFTAKHTSSLIEDSIYGINLDNYTDEQISVMARSASELKAAIEAGTQTYVPCGNNNSGHHVGTAADLTIDDSTFFSGWISVIDRAIVELDNSVLYYGASISIGAARVDGISDVNLNGWDAQTSKWFSSTPLASADGFREGEIATMNVTDSIVRNVLWGNGNAGGGIIQVGGSYVHDNGYAGECAGVLNITRSDFSTTPVNDKGEVVETSNSDIVVVKHNGTVNVIDSKFTSGKVEIETVAATETEPAKAGSFNVSGESTLNIGNLTGGSVYGKDVTLVDSKISTTETDSDFRIIRFLGTNNKITGNSEFNGVIGVGHGGGYTKEKVSVTITGDFSGSNVLVGGSVTAENGEVFDHQLNIGDAEGARTTAYFGQLGAFGDVIVNNADVDYHYTFIRGDFTVTDSSLKNTSVNTFIAGDANVVVDNSEWTMGGYSYLGSYGDYMYGNASLTLNSSVMTVTANFGIQEQDGKKVVFTINESSVIVKTKLSVQGDAEIIVDDKSTITAADLDMKAGSILIKVTDELAFGETGAKKIIDVNGDKIDDAELARITVDKVGYVAVKDAEGDIVLKNAMTDVESADALATALKDEKTEFVYINSKINVADEEGLDDLINTNYSKLIFGAAGLLLWNSDQAAWLTDEYKYAANILLAPTAAVIDPGTEGNSVEINFTDGATGIIDDITDANLDPVESGVAAEKLVVNSTGNGEIRSNITLTSANIELNNNDDSSEELKITGEITTGGDVVINNKNSIVGAEGEAVLNGGSNEHGAQVTASNVTLNNDGHANIDFTATGTEEDSGIITIVNNSKKTLEGQAEGKIVRIVASENNDGHVANFTSTASEYTEIADQSVENSDFVGKLVITGDTEFVGEEASSVSVTAKVINGATAKVDKDAVVNVGEYLFAGDEAYSGLPNSTNGGIIEISGTVNASQTNSNADGSIIIENGGTLNTPILNLENGNLSDRNSGSVEIKAGGTVSAAQINLITGDAEMTIAGDFNVTNSRGSETGVAFLNSGTVTINGGKLNFDMSDPAKVDVSGDQTGLVNSKDIIINGGELLVYSQKGVTNNGTFKVTGGEGETKAVSTIDANVTGNAIQLEGGVLKDSNIAGTVDAYGVSDFIGTNSVSSLYMGYNVADNTKDATVNITGEYVGTVIVGDDDASGKYVLNIGEANGDRTYFGDKTNGSILNVHAANGTANIVNTDYYLHQIVSDGTINVTNSTLNLKGVSQNIKNGGSIILDGSQWYGSNGFNSNLGIGSWSYNTSATGSGSLTLRNKSYAEFYRLGLNDAGEYKINAVVNDSEIVVEEDTYIGAGAELSLVSGTLTSQIVNNKGQIVVDEKSSFIVTDTFTSTGTITVNVTDGWRGSKVILDAAVGTEIGAVEVDAADAADGLKVKFDEATGDLIAYNIDTNTAYVDGNWPDVYSPDYTFGEELAEGKFSGINAFGHAADAIREAAVNANIGKIVVDENTSTELYAFAVNNNITTENKNGLVVDLGNHGVSIDKDMNTVVNGEINDDYEGAESTIIANGITIDENVKVIADTIYGNGLAYEMNINGEVEVNGAYLRKEGDIEVAGKLTVKDSISLIADEQTPSLTVTEDGEFNAADVYADVNSEITVNGTANVGNLESSGSVNVGASGTLKGGVNNKGIMNVAGTVTEATVNNAGTVNVVGSNAKIDAEITGTDGEFIVKDDVKFTSSKDITAGLVFVGDPETDENSGAEFIVGKGTKLSATGEEGVINVRDGAKLVTNGDVLANYFRLTGDAEINGKFALEGSSDSLVKEGAELVVNGSLTNTYTTDENGVVSYPVSIENLGTLTVNGTVALAGKVEDIDNPGVIKNTGTINVNKGAVIDAEITGAGFGVIYVKDGADFTTSKNITADELYVGYNGTDDTAASKFTVAEGTEVLLDGENAVVNVRKESSITVKGKLTAGQIRLRGAATVDGGTMTLDGSAGIEVMETGSLVVKNGGTVTNSFVDGQFVSIVKGGSVSIDGAKFSISDITVQNEGTINVSGISTVNATVEGNAVKTAYAATLKESTLNADVSAYGALTLDNSKVNGNITGNAVITLKGENTVTLGDNSQVYYFYVADEVTLSAGSDINTVAIYGDNSKSTLNISGGLLNGNYVYGVKLNLDIADYNEVVTVNTALANIKSVEGFEVEAGLAGSYIFTDDKGTADDTTDDVTYKLVQSGNEISFKEFASTDTNLETPEFIVTDDVNLPNVDVVMAEGYAYSYIGYQADVEVGALSKSDNGGVTNITVAQEGSLKVNGDIEAVNTLATGYKSGLKAENVTGSGYNDVIYVGALNDGVSLKSIDLKTGWDYMYVGYDSDVTVNGSVSGLSSLIIDALGEVTIKDNYVAGDYANTITALGDLTINGNIVNADINIGTYITTGWNVNFKSGDITYLSGVSFSGGDLVNGEAEYSFNAEKIDGTTYNNVFYFGYAADVTIGDINGRGGYDQIVTGIYGDVKFDGNIANIQVISVGWATDFESDKISDVMSFVFTGGVSSTDKAELTVEAVTTTDYSDYIYIGNFTDANIGDINGMGGYDTIVTGYDADVTAGNISNVGQIVVGSGVSSDDKAKFTATSISGTEYNDAVVFGNFVEAYVGDIDLGAGYNQIVTGYDNDVTVGNITGVGQLVVGNGVSSDDKAEFTATSISGTEYNDTVVFGNFVEANVGDIDLGAGYNAISTGYDADVTTGDITGVGQLVVGNGVSSENESEFDARNITGTQYNDVFSFGHYTDVEFDSLTLGEGNDYLANGSYSEIETAGKIDFGAGYDNMVVGNYSRAEAGSLDFGADYDTLTLGYKSELTLGKNVENVEAIYANIDSKIIVTDADEDVNFDKVAGTWQNATIYDIEGVLADGENALAGSVYSNEWDIYTFNVTGDSNNDLSIIGADNTIQVDLYQMVDGEWTSLGTVHPFYDIETGKSSLDNGQYAIAVKVDGADFNKENDDNNKYSFTAKLA
ncbi:MAG: hypothetical protein E7042_08580 [Lentisphaerae bacterium]|nr:hypothetical protein [Lentisphaerota bacterium]